MKTPTTSPLALATAPSGPSLVEEAFEALAESFAQFCLMAGTESLTQMMGCDVTRLWVRYLTRKPIFNIRA